MQVTATTTVKQSPAEVWSALANHEGMSAWAPGLQATLDKVGAAERNGVGAVRRISVPGPAPAIVEEIVAFEPDAKLGYKALSGVPFKEYAGEVALRPAGSGTEIRWTLRITERVPVVEKAAAAVVARTLLSALVRQVKKAG